MRAHGTMSLLHTFKVVCELATDCMFLIHFVSYVCWFIQVSSSQSVFCEMSFSASLDCLKDPYLMLKFICITVY